MPPRIPDPKMNEKEYRYGIIDINGQIYAYDKENKSNPKRCICAGFEIDLSNVKFKDLQNPFDWYGNKVTERVVIKKADVESAANASYQPLIAKKIYPMLRELQENDEWPIYESELTNSESEDSDG